MAKRGRVFICRTSKSGLKCKTFRGKAGPCPPGCKSSKKRSRKSARKYSESYLKIPGPFSGLHRRRRRR
jgi:hypothetical protein